MKKCWKSADTCPLLWRKDDWHKPPGCATMVVPLKGFIFLCKFGRPQGFSGVKVPAGRVCGSRSAKPWKTSRRIHVLLFEGGKTVRFNRRCRVWEWKLPYPALSASSVITTPWKTRRTILTDLKCTSTAASAESIPFIRKPSKRKGHKNGWTVR